MYIPLISKNVLVMRSNRGIEMILCLISPSALQLLSKKEKCVLTYWLLKGALSGEI